MAFAHCAKLQLAQCWRAGIFGPVRPSLFGLTGVKSGAPARGAGGGGRPPAGSPPPALSRRGGDGRVNWPFWFWNSRSVVPAAFRASRPSLHVPPVSRDSDLPSCPPDPTAREHHAAPSLAAGTTSARAHTSALRTIVPAKSMVVALDPPGKAAADRAGRPTSDCS